MTIVAHLTSVHPRYDTRIFYKQCRSLAAAGYTVWLVVADGLGSETKDAVNIVDVGKARGRSRRITKTTRDVLGAALALDADIYQIHDPELLPVAVILKRRGKRVVFDSHEDVPQQILSKPYLPRALRGVTSGLVGYFEHILCKRLDRVMAATPTIRDKFVGMGITTVLVRNFPVLEHSEPAERNQVTNRQVCYVGGISTIRGAREIVAAMALSKTDATLALAGAIQEPGLSETLQKEPGWRKVDYLGFLTREGVQGVYESACAGIVTLHPTPAYLTSLPVKMFEYMFAGLPVIASDFPLFKEIVEGSRCGICVNPHDPQAIADAIDYFVTNPEIATAMGENGRRSVQEKYNWRREEETLMALYRDLIGIPTPNVRA